MNDHADKERLLSDVLAEETSFREALLENTLRLARRRRHARQARQTFLSLALLLGVSFLARRALTPPGRSSEPAKAYVVVRTQPLPQQALMHTHALPASSLVASIPPINILTTAGAGYRVREIDDEELLALAKPTPVVLVRYSPHQAELVFPNSSDRP